MNESSAAISWRKSSRCASGACVEVADAVENVLMRDSKSPEGTPLAFPKGVWTDFMIDIKAGRFHAN
ncbi:DUF397 domain-containing protein [Asanoa sp. WMMD1127]|uniref:DUF397 domain-containing protein n=1 Tax=Asanoa sp. WMMD1127 TaxID=3016107 RepID=UPI002416CED5|nr:DUF397 domain-containing protein [Asanoa sp. WMMD1127]MDG4822269.1 DUF397 domain-containing protein [Asanoa sp. WMMD1127]